jgi:hypothetical protein
MNLKKRLVALERSLPVTFAPELSKSVHWIPAKNLPIHRWFRYREGFSPTLLDHFPDSKYSLDPFCGCGTTLLESSIKRRHSFGVELNPLAVFVTRTKTAAYSDRDARAFGAAGRGVLRKYPQARVADSPSYPLLKKLFQPESMVTLLKMKSAIESAHSEAVRNLLLLVWLSILEDSSNVFKEGNGLKYRNKRRRPGLYETRPDSEWIPRYFGGSIPGFIENLWNRKCAEVVDDLKHHRLLPKYCPEVRQGSCLDEDSLDFGRPFDLAVFSPPYANRFDYFEAFKIELWMGGFVSAQEDLARLRKRSMRNNLTASRSTPEKIWTELEPYLENMDPTSSSVRMGIKGTLRGYFEDTRNLLTSLRKTVRPGGKVVIVVGNSAYARSIVPTDLLVAKLGQEEGFRLEEIKVARNLHVSSQQRASLAQLECFMRESVVVLRNQ